MQDPLPLTAMRRATARPGTAAAGVAGRLALRVAGSEMAGRILAFDWSKTALGAMDGWSDSVTSALELCLGSRICSCIYWGAAQLIVYNDAYGSILGAKHPWALGRAAAEVWPEILDVIGPLLHDTYTSGRTTGADDAPIFINRAGYVEEFYCSFSYAPIIDRTGIIEGVFATLPETSVRVIGERRLRTLQRLASDTREIKHATRTLDIAAQVLRDNPCDVPFAAIYGWPADSSRAHLLAAANIEPGAPLCPSLLDLESDDELARRVASARRRGIATLQIAAHHAPVPCGAWRIPPRQLVLLALSPRGDDALQAVLLAAVNPHKRIDPAHLEFFRLLADQLRRALAEACSHEQEEARVRDLQERARAAQEAERVRIARDLHDTLLQSLQGLRFLLQAGVARLDGDDPSARDLIADALRAADHAIEDGRAVLSLLRSTTPAAQELETALAALGGELVAGTGIAFEIALSGHRRTLAADVWNEVYGLFREAVTNAVRHSGAGRVAATLHYGEDFSLVVEDDGSGFDASAARAPRHGHYGLQGMRERAANVAATLCIGGAPGRGTRITLGIAGARAYRD